MSREATAKKCARPFTLCAWRPSECSEIKRRHMFVLSVGTYNITFGPTTESSVSLVIVEAAQGHEH